MANRFGGLKRAECSAPADTCKPESIRFALIYVDTMCIIHRSTTLNAGGRIHEQSEVDRY
jgi:hypothetical protein